MNYWQGRNLTLTELECEISQLSDLLRAVISRNFDFEGFREYCHEFSVRIKTDSALVERLILPLKDETSIDEARTGIFEIADFLDKWNLKNKIERELGSLQEFNFRRPDPRSNTFERWAPLGFLVHILPSNSFALPVLAAIEGMLCGNVNFIKLSERSGAFAVAFFNEMFKNELSGNFKDRLIIARFSSDRRDLLNHVFKLADGVSAWGGEESLTSIKQLVPTSSRFIEWGHKISFQYLTKSFINDDSLLNGLATDLFILNQQACSSPQCLFLEEATQEELKNFSQRFSKILDEHSKNQPLPKLSNNEAAELTRTVEVHKTQAALAFAEVIQPMDNGWRLLLDENSGLSASPLFRTLWVRSIKQQELFNTFWPLRSYLQTVGLAAKQSEIASLSSMLINAGALRIRKPGQMLTSYSGEAHDGVYSLARFMKRITLDVGDTLAGISSFDEISAANDQCAPAGPIMKKADFQKQSPQDSDSELYFKSGGSSGTPKISIFTYDDYHLQMRAAADGLIAAGLEPNDRCMNLFYGGGLYGGFISFFTILEFIRAKQFPMAAHEDFSFVCDSIKKFNVNTLLGMPSYLMQLFEAGSNQFKEIRSVKKIFYGGEHFDLKQREFLHREFGVELIRSASYGSVDAGPLGFQCSHCQNGVHHLHSSLQHLEILELDSDQPALMGSVGRLVVSSKHRRGQHIWRYEIGDLGRWVNGNCPCGRSSPRFELMGRFGDVFKAGGSFLNYNKFKEILSSCFDYQYDLQLDLTKEDHKDALVLLLDTRSGLDSLKVLEIIVSQYNDLKEVFKEGLVTLHARLIAGTEFVRSGASGKLLHVIEGRKF